MNTAKTGRAALLAALNAAANEGVVFAESDLTFSTPGDTLNPNRNTEFTYTATPTSNYEGSAVAYYDRLDLTAWFASYGIETVEMVKGATNVGELITAMNTRFDLGFTADDFDLNIAIAPEATEVVLEALPGSFAFKGQLLVGLVASPLADAVGFPELGGLNIAIVDSEAQV